MAFQAEDEEIALPDVMRDLSHQRQICVEHRNSESESIVLSWVRQHASRNLWALGLSSLRRASDGSLLVVFCLTCANGPNPPLLVDDRSVFILVVMFLPNALTWNSAAMTASRNGFGCAESDRPTPNQNI